MDVALTAKTEKADITLEDFGGTAMIHSQYGRLQLVPAPTLRILTIEAARTDIVVATKQLTDFRYDIVTTYASIRVPDNVNKYLVKSRDKQLFKYSMIDHKPEIIIRNSYSSVILLGEKPLVTK